MADKNFNQQKKKIAGNRKADQKAIDQALIPQIKKVDYLASYLALQRRGYYP